MISRVFSTLLAALVLFTTTVQAVGVSYQLRSGDNKLRLVTVNQQSHLELGSDDDNVPSCSKEGNACGYPFQDPCCPGLVCSPRGFYSECVNPDSIKDDSTEGGQNNKSRKRNRRSFREMKNRASVDEELDERMSFLAASVKERLKEENRSRKMRTEYNYALAKGDTTKPKRLTRIDRRNLVTYKKN
eukprot:CFRG0339T1